MLIGGDPPPPPPSAGAGGLFHRLADFRQGRPAKHSGEVESVLPGGSVAQFRFFRCENQLGFAVSVTVGLVPEPHHFGGVAEKISARSHTKGDKVVRVNWMR